VGKAAEIQAVPVFHPDVHEHGRCRRHAASDTAAKRGARAMTNRNWTYRQ